MIISICLVTNNNTDLTRRVAIRVAEDESSDAAAEVTRIGWIVFFRASRVRMFSYLSGKSRRCHLTWKCSDIENMMSSDWSDKLSDRF